MKRYIGTKLIEAEPARRYTCPTGFVVVEESRETVSVVEDAMMKEATSCAEGYQVCYPDSYVSWSPKDVFEEAYRPIDGMSFGLAIDAMRKGFKVRRRGWNGKNQHIELASAISYRTPDGTIVNTEHDAIGNQAVAFCGTSGVQMGWLASQADMLAEDWEIVP